MDFWELTKQRCTTRGFTDKEIDKNDLNRILSVGRVAPTDKISSHRGLS